MLAEATERRKQLSKAKGKVQYAKTKNAQAKKDELKELLEIAKSTIGFPVICEELFAEGFADAKAHFFDPKPYCGSNGREVHGLSLLKVPTGGDMIENGAFLEYVEVFLLRNGSLKAFDTIEIWETISDTELIQFNLKRQPCIGVTLTEEHLEEAIETVTNELFEEFSLLE